MGASGQRCLASDLQEVRVVDFCATCSARFAIEMGYGNAAFPFCNSFICCEQIAREGVCKLGAFRFEVGDGLKKRGSLLFKRAQLLRLLSIKLAQSIRNLG